MSTVKPKTGKGGRKKAASSAKAGRKTQAAERRAELSYGLYEMPDENIRQKISGYLGLAQRAGKMAAGDGAAREALLKGKAVLLLLAQDAAATVREELQALCIAAELPLLLWPDKTDLGLILGKKFGTKLAGKASILGGAILLLIGLKIFATGVFHC